jgi:hypothetical protein
MKVVYDIIFSCKICIGIVYLFYCVAMYTQFIPVEYSANIAVKVLLSILLGLAATIITMPLFFVLMLGLGITIRFAKDLCSGCCSFCQWFSKRKGA